MNGYATRARLAAALHDDVHGDVSAPTPAPALANAAPRTEHAAPRTQHWSSPLGTPREEELIKAARREKLYGRCFRWSMWIAVLLIGVSVGHQAKHRRDLDAIDTAVSYRTKAAKLAPGMRVCELDTVDGCLICMHKDILGQQTVSTHC